MDVPFIKWSSSCVLLYEIKLSLIAHLPAHCIVMQVNASMSDSSTISSVHVPFPSVQKTLGKVVSVGDVIATGPPDPSLWLFESIPGVITAALTPQLPKGTC